MFGALVLLASSVAIVAAKAVSYPANRYIETMIPMRDGVNLHTIIVFPRDRDENSKYPTVMDRSPYGYQDLEMLADLFVPFGMVAIGQDMRGTEKSQGNFTMWQSDAADSRDLGDWIVKQPWSNGEVMTFGASADGIGSLQTPKTSPSWLTAQYIAWATSSIYQILLPYGAYKQKTAEDWLLGLTMPMPEVVNSNIQVVHENEAHTAFWEGVELGEADFGKVHARSAFWGGWYDLFILGTIQAFEGYNEHAAESVRHTAVMTIDPLGHCLDSGDFFTEDAVMGRTGLVIAQAFEVFGVRPVTRNGVKNITFYVMSSNDEAGKSAGQFWTTLETWPKAVATDFFLHADRTASPKPPSTGDASSTSFKYDPADPAPTSGGNNLPDSIGGSIPCGPLDQSEVDKRSDVLTFQTEIFSNELALTGALMANLFVSSDAIDTDFTVKISDVYPTGEVLILQDNAIRMRWREGGVEPVFMKKGAVYDVEINLWNTSYVVAPGHALRFSISSSNFPRFSANPNNGVLLADPAYPGVAVTAVNTIYHSLRYPSKITLPVVAKHQLPQVHVLKEVEKSYPLLSEGFIRKNIANVDKLAKRMMKK